MVADKQAILKSKDWDYDRFEVPGWGELCIRSLSAKERLDIAEQYGKQDQLTGAEALEFYCKVIAAALVDDDGNPIFDSQSAEDMEALSARNWNRLRLVATRILDFNGATEDAVKELEKN